MWFCWKQIYYWKTKCAINVWYIHVLGPEQMFVRIYACNNSLWEFGSEGGLRLQISCLCPKDRRPALCAPAACPVAPPDSWLLSVTSTASYLCTLHYRLLVCLRSAAIIIRFRAIEIYIHICTVLVTGVHLLQEQLTQLTIRQFPQSTSNL